MHQIKSLSIKVIQLKHEELVKKKQNKNFQKVMQVLTGEGSTEC